MGNIHIYANNVNYVVCVNVKAVEKQSATRSFVYD
jgi:hypothetical protein